MKPCKAPMKDGKLCQRRDAKFCPFHGPIIPRDDKGNPLPEEDEKETAEKKNKNEEGAGDIMLPLVGQAREEMEVMKGRKKRKSEGGVKDRKSAVRGRPSL